MAHSLKTPQRIVTKGHVFIKIIEFQWFGDIGHFFEDEVKQSEITRASWISEEPQAPDAP